MTVNITLDQINFYTEFQTYPHQCWHGLSHIFLQGNEWSVVITGSLKEGERQQASYTWQGLLSWGDELQSQTAGVVMAATSPVKTD